VPPKTTTRHNAEFSAKNIFRINTRHTNMN